MPITLGALRKQRADKRRAAINLRVKSSYKSAVAEMKKEPTAEKLRAAYSRLDRAAKSGVIHRNKAARLKSRLQRRLK